MIGFDSVEIQAAAPLWGEILLILGCLALFVYSVYATRYQPPKVRIAAAFLRAILLGLGMLLVHQPAFVSKKTRPLARRLAVMVDRSGSMAESDGGESSRYEQSFSIVGDLVPEGVEVDVFEFDHALSEPLGLDLSPRQVSGKKTDFYTSLNQLLNAPKRYASVLLISDGHDLGRFSNAPNDEASSWLKRVNAPPVNTMLVGHQAQGADVSVLSVEAPAFSYVRAPLRISVTVLVRDINNFTSQVQLLEEEQVVQIRDLALDEQGFGKVDFEFYPEEMGEHVYSVFVPPHHLENNRENNRQEILVEIGRDKISVLHITGSITWDLQGMRAMFERDPLVDLTAFYIMRTRDHLNFTINNRGIDQNEMALVPFPTEEIFDRQLFGFDVVVFQDFDAGNYFTDSYQARKLMRKLREFVLNHRGGLLVMGGPRTAGGPSLALTPLRDVLAVEPPVYRKPYDETVLVPQLTTAGENHPILRRFVPEEQPFFGSMQGVKLQQGSELLIQSAEKEPLLALREVGQGRTLFLNTNATYKWRRDAIADGRTAERYHDFWSQSFKWITQDPSMSQCRIRAVKTEDSPLSVEVDLLLRRENYAPASSQDATLLMSPIGRDESVQELVLTTDRSGRAQGSFTAARAGYYRISLKEAPWKDLSRPAYLFLGGSQEELRNAEPVPETLSRLALLTGGNFVPKLRSVTDDDLRWRSLASEQIVETQRLKWRNNLWFLPLILVVAAAEWALRRSNHLA